MEGPGRCFSADGVEVQSIFYLVFFGVAWMVLVSFAFPVQMEFPFRVDPVLQALSKWVIFSIAVGGALLVLIAVLKHIWTSI